MDSLARWMRRPFRAFRGWINRPTGSQITDLRAENRALRRRVDELSDALDDGLQTLGRTGLALRAAERRVAPGGLAASTAWTATTGPGAPAEDGASAPTASVVIVTLNRADSLDECLRVLRGLDYPQFEVVVVNGPSNDGTATLLSEWGDRVKAVQCSVANIAAARNVGLAAAAGDVVAFLDDDTYPEPSWLTELVGGLDLPGVVGVGGEVRNRAGSGVEFLHIVGARLGETIKARGVDPSGWYDSPYSERYLVMPGGNSAYWRAPLLDIGGFDEAFEYGGEDGDLDIRLRDAGFRLRRAPAAIVYHQALSNADRSHDGVMRSRYRFLRSKAYFTLKHASETHSAGEIAASNARAVDRFRDERRDAVASGSLPAADLEAFDDEARRALADGTALWLEGGPQLRDREWFAAGSSAFVPFPVPLPGPKLHECIVIGPGTSLAAAAAAAAERLAAEGNVSRIVRAVDGPGRVTVEAGVWRHDLPMSGPADPEVAGETVAAEIRRIHAARPLTGLRPIGLPASWLDKLRKLDVPIES